MLSYTPRDISHWISLIATLLETANMQRIGFIVFVIAFAGLFSSRSACAIDPIPEPRSSEEVEVTHPNLTFKTLGGRQFWGDVQFFHGWRIQHNVLMKDHYRLLDADDMRHAWGTLDECRQKLAEIRQTEKLPAMSGKAVILLHGITRSSKHMAKLREPFEKAGYSVFAMDYPSTRVPVQESAGYLKKVIDSLEGITEINFVVHSMGGIVVRTYLQEHAPRDARIGRMVMIGSPNNGANLADMLQEKLNGIFKPIFGPAGQQLVTDTDGFIANLPIPDFEFAVIAGARGHKDGFNPLIPGDDDGIVSVASTRLPGAADFLQVEPTDVLKVDSTHTFLPTNASVHGACVRFMQSGSLRADGTKAPIARIP